MSEDPLRESQELIEEMANGLYAPCDSCGEVRLPLAWATLQIDMTLMPEEDRGKVYQAERLLREAGITFDTGSGCGFRDWELDWSLSGAYLKVREIKCMGGHDDKPILDYAFWAIYSSPNGTVLAYAYCSDQCRAEAIGKRPQWTLLLKMESRVGLHEEGEG